MSDQNNSNPSESDPATAPLNETPLSSEPVSPPPKEEVSNPASTVTDQNKPPMTSTLYSNPNMDTIDEVPNGGNKKNKLLVAFILVAMLAAFGFLGIFAYQQMMEGQTVVPTPEPLNTVSRSPTPSDEIATPTPVNEEEAELQKLEFNEEELEAEFEEMEQEAEQL